MLEGHRKNDNEPTEYLKEANRKLLLQNQKLLVETERCSRELLGAKSKVNISFKKSMHRKKKHLWSEWMIVV